MVTTYANKTANNIKSFGNIVTIVNANKLISNINIYWKKVVDIYTLYNIGE